MRRIFHIVPDAPHYDCGLMLSLARAMHDRGVIQRFCVPEQHPALNEISLLGEVELRSLPKSPFENERLLNGLRRKIVRWAPNSVISWCQASAVIARPLDHLVRIAYCSSQPKEDFDFSAVDLTIWDDPSHAQEISNKDSGHEALVLPGLSVGSLTAPVDRMHFETPENAFLICARVCSSQLRGLEPLLDAVGSLPNVWLWLLCENSSDPRLSNRISALNLSNRIRLIDEFHDVAGYSAAADLFVSTYGSPMSACDLIKTWSIGVPTILPCAPEGADFVCHEYNCFLATNEEELYMVLRRLVYDRSILAGLSAAAHSTLADFCNRNIEVDSVLNFIDACASRRSGIFFKLKKAFSLRSL